MWFPPGQPAQLFVGFLPDQDGLGWFVNRQGTTLAEQESVGALVLLADAGRGKSVALGVEVNRLRGTLVTDAKITSLAGAQGVFI